MFGIHRLAGWRHDHANLALGGGNLAILLIGAQLKSALGLSISLTLIGLTSAWAWYANLKRYRMVADTPTSNIASAPQGYVELVGRGRQPPGDTLVSPVNGLPCLWYRYRIERKKDNRWEHVESGVSHDTFGLADGSGQALIDPDGAEILASRKQVSITGGYRKTEWTLIEGETIYVIGEHATLGGAYADLDRKADLAALLTEWKRARRTLLARFDADRDGEISLEEWERARKAAADEVDRTHLDIRLKDGIHLVRKPADGRPFLIANREVAALARHFRLWGWLHLATLLATLYGLVSVGRVA